MNNYKKLQSITILLIAIIGILIGQIKFIETYSEYLIMPALLIMLFLVFIQIPLKDIRSSLKNFKFTSAALILNFIWTPILILILGKLFLHNNSELLIGFIMLMVTPCTDWYLIFTKVSKGNVAHLFYR